MKNSGWDSRHNGQDTQGAAGVNMDSVFGNNPAAWKRKDPAARQTAGRQPQQAASAPKRLLYLKGTSTRIGGIFLAVDRIHFHCWGCHPSAVSGSGRSGGRFWHCAESRNDDLRAVRTRVPHHGDRRNGHGVLGRTVPEIRQGAQRPGILRGQGACTEDGKVCKSGCERSEEDDPERMVLSGASG